MTGGFHFGLWERDQAQAGRRLHARITIPARPEPKERHLAARRARYRRRLELLGVRPASLRKYLDRGFPGPFLRACRMEMRRVVWDLRYRGRG
jgi:hypothetical protein